MEDGLDQPQPDEDPDDLEDDVVDPDQGSIFTVCK